MSKIPFLILLPLVVSVAAIAQEAQHTNPDLLQLLDKKKIIAFNRDITPLAPRGNKQGIHINAKENYGVAWLTGYELSNGSMEFDVRGKDVLQQSFVGLAFHGLNDSTMDVIYFRPFNFQVADANRRSHSVQYISLPSHDWEQLRTHHPGKYEKGLKHPPDPDEWFHVRVLIKHPEVRVYVNHNPQPDLVVKQLNNRKHGKMGFWTGHRSDGDFSNLKITPIVK